MKIKKYIFLVFLLCLVCTSNVYYRDNVGSIDGMDQLNSSDTSTPVHTEYDGIALTLIIVQGVLIGGGFAGYFIYKKKKEKKEKEKQNNSSSTSNQIVFYSSYDNDKKEETKTEAKVETTPVFTSSSTFSTSSIVNGPNQNNNLN